MPDQTDVTVQTEGAAASDAQPQESLSAKVGSWFRNFAGGGETEASDTETDGASEGQSPEKASTPAVPETHTYTQDEIDRRVQSEADRRDAKRNAVADRERRQRLRREDPIGYAEEDERAESQQESTGHVAALKQSTAQAIDSAYTGVLFEESSEYKLTPAEWEAIHVKHQDNPRFGVGIDGRQLVMTESLAALRKRWTLEGEKTADARLRKNSAFRKDVLSENRYLRAEPELVPAANGSGHDSSLNDFIRGVAST